MLNVVKKNLAEFSRGNWDAFRETLDEKVVYEERATLQRIEGREDMIQAVQRWKSAFPDLTATIKSFVKSGNKIAVEIEWEGTNLGEFEGPFGKVPPSGARGKIGAVEIFTLKRGKIAEAHHYFDLMTILLEIGLVPRFERRAEAAAPPLTH